MTLLELAQTSELAPESYKELFSQIDPQLYPRIFTHMPIDKIINMEYCKQPTKCLKYYLGVKASNRVSDMVPLVIKCIHYIDHSDLIQFATIVWNQDKSLTDDMLQSFVDHCPADLVSLLLRTFPFNGFEQHIEPFVDFPITVNIDQFIRNCLTKIHDGDLYSACLYLTSVVANAAIHINSCIHRLSDLHKLYILELYGLDNPTQLYTDLILSYLRRLPTDDLVKIRLTKWSARDGQFIGVSPTKFLRRIRKAQLLTYSDRLELVKRCRRDQLLEIVSKFKTQYTDLELNHIISRLPTFTQITIFIATLSQPLIYHWATTIDAEVYNFIAAVKAANKFINMEPMVISTLQHARLWASDIEDIVIKLHFNTLPIFMCILARAQTSDLPKLLKRLPLAQLTPANYDTFIMRMLMKPNVDNLIILDNRRELSVAILIAVIAQYEQADVFNFAYLYTWTRLSAEDYSKVLLLVVQKISPDDITRLLARVIPMRTITPDIMLEAVRRCNTRNILELVKRFAVYNLLATCPGLANEIHHRALPPAILTEIDSLLAHAPAQPRVTADEPPNDNDDQSDTETSPAPRITTLTRDMLLFQINDWTDITPEEWEVIVRVCPRRHYIDLYSRFNDTELVAKSREYLLAHADIGDVPELYGRTFTPTSTETAIAMHRTRKSVDALKMYMYNKAVQFLGNPRPSTRPLFNGKFSPTLELSCTSFDGTPYDFTGIIPLPEDLFIIIIFQEIYCLTHAQLQRMFENTDLWKYECIYDTTSGAWRLPPMMDTTVSLNFQRPDPKQYPSYMKLITVYVPTRQIFNMLNGSARVFHIYDDGHVIPMVYDAIQQTGHPNYVSYQHCNAPETVYNTWRLSRTNFTTTSKLDALFDRRTPWYRRLFNAI